MAKINATDQDILGHHLPYEFEMLQGTYLALEKGGHDTIIANALIESFCIHARQLVEFFNNQQGRRATEFTGGNYVAAHLGSLGDTATKLNTQIAHLTGQRTTDDTKKIGPDDRRKLLTALEREAQNFAAHLSQNHKGIFAPPTPITLIDASAQPCATNHIATI
jgi:hypothetical protein